MFSANPVSGSASPRDIRDKWAPVLSTSIDRTNRIDTTPLLSVGTTPSLLSVNAIPARTVVQTNSESNLRALTVAQDGSVWIGGSLGEIAVSVDDGFKWTKVPVADGSGLGFRAICASSSQNACAMSAGPSEDGESRIYRTSNGGATWECVLKPTEPGLFFSAMVFCDTDNGLVLSDPQNGQFVLFRTNNGGQSWHRVDPKRMPPAMPGEGAFSASNTCLAVHGSSHVWFATGGARTARVFYSSDGGDTWDVTDTNMPSSPSSGLFSLSFCTKEIGVAVGGDYKGLTFAHNVYLTRDGGVHWEPVPNHNLNGLYLSCVVWTSGEELLVADGTSSELSEFNSIVFDKSGRWAVGQNGKCVKFDLK